MKPAKEITTFSKRKTSFDPSFPFEILYSGNCAKNMENFHWHDFMEMSYIRQGKGVYEIEDKVIEVQPGDIIIVNNIEKHRVTYAETEKLYETVIHFSPGFIWSGVSGSFDYRYLGLFLYDGKHFNNKLQLDLESLTVFNNTIEEILEEIAEKRPYYELMIKSKLLTIISLILRQSKSNFNDDKAFLKKINNIKRLENIIDFINQNYTNEITLSVISKEFYMNPSYFSEYFKKNVGISFNEYVTRLKVTKAIALLEDDTKKITTIAFECGFNSLASFYSAFKKITGYTPGEYNFR